jgi:hypothetical protein
MLLLIDMSYSAQRQHCLEVCVKCCIQVSIQSVTNAVRELAYSSCAWREGPCLGKLPLHVNDCSYVINIRSQ